MSTEEEEEDTGELLAPIVDEADLILPSDSHNFASNNEIREPIIDEVENELSTGRLYEDAGPTTSIGTLNSFQGIFVDKPSLPRDGIPLPTGEPRPFLRREGSRGQNTAPAAPETPPEAPPPPSSLEPEITAEPIQDVGNIVTGGTDSLSLQQLRALVRDMPGKAEPAPYAFMYGDKASMMEEVEEWFSYGIEERNRIAKTHASFAREWGRINGITFADGGSGSRDGDWANTSESIRRKFVSGLMQSLKGEGDARLCSLETLVYLALGCWYETAGIRSEGWLDIVETKDKIHRTSSEESVSSIGGYIDRREESRKMLEAQYGDNGLQVEWIRHNMLKILEHGGVQTLVDVFKATVDRECNGDMSRSNVTAIQREAEQRETWCAATLLYIALEFTQSCTDTEKQLSLRSQFYVINCLRWDETIQLPLVKVLLLTWKAVLVELGGLQDVATVKDSFQEPDPNLDKTSKPIITASPLDYHSFRQEITSKYPAYVPPTGQFPMEPEQKSILPPLRQSHNRTPNSSFSTPSGQHGSSIFHQPVHIATPAPSPPPSPAASKGGKKQNYQTNQLFPFLYPPLDSTSNSLGGKGSTFMQDSLVGRRWEGADIPISILEASELFSSRTRATRALKQLWESREGFLQYERGWDDGQEKNYDIEDLKLDSDDEDTEEKPLDGPLMETEKTPRILDGSVNDRLETVEEFYREGLPHLQSIVVVVLKTILATLTSLITNPTGPPAAASIYENGNGTAQANGVDTTTNSQYDLSNLNLEELETLRTQEITAKAASGLMLLMLKWFKVSHVLKFEYLCQLLVDANYVPIILKLLQSQEMERIVNCKADRSEFNLFQYCHSISRNPPSLANSAPIENQLSDSSEDECAPPPIRRRREGGDVSTQPTPSQTMNQIQQPPEVDELGLPTTGLPSSPVTHFSWRNFFSSINFLRVLQKTCKHKAHRNLMLVQYKSAAYLKKALKVPQRELRLYTLKLFKNQVPYCGRKWRQGNMRVITAVYLHCRPELRDDWLLSADVDADVELAVPMEQSLRALTHFYNLKHFAAKMSGGQDAEGFGLAERDFFERELDKLEWNDDEIEYQDQQQGQWEQGFGAENM